WAPPATRPAPTSTSRPASAALPATPCPTCRSSHRVPAVMRRAAALLFLCGLALVPVMHPLHVDLLGSVLIPADVCLIAAGVVWLLAAARRQVPFRWGPFPVAVGCYLAVVLLGAARGATTEAVNYLVIGFYVGGLGLLAYNLVPVVIGFDAVVKACSSGPRSPSGSPSSACSSSMPAFALRGTTAC